MDLKQYKRIKELNLYVTGLCREINDSTIETFIAVAANAVEQINNEFLEDAKKLSYLPLYLPLTHLYNQLLRVRTYADRKDFSKARVQTIESCEEVIANSNVYLQKMEYKEKGL
ncbi:hypothetical protein [Alteribacillus bidgolensis]|uniref:Uncharacterized protein n=1 Tax=Alteribacillus bidgolensis TaxID=930129 RepID=A0A1G8H6T9_9BACI|nr:hypothetical protein [Alteribacillus bidgolensis]SDI02269.1 hypothetical protein SAMN05216352_104132 [Alteribacillus bidgolensis]